jgi:hypothetical protein
MGGSMSRPFSRFVPAPARPAAGRAALDSDPARHYDWDTRSKGLSQLGKEVADVSHF